MFVWVFLCSCVPGSGGNPADPLGPNGDGSSGIGAVSAYQAVKIQAWSPSGSLTLSDASTTIQNFSVSATSFQNLPITYRWSYTRPDTVVVSAADSSTGSYDFDPSAKPVGNYTVRVEADDTKSTDEHSWTMKITTPPTISSPSPSGAKGVAVGNTLNLSASVTDALGDPLTTTWTIDGGASAYLVDNGIAAGVASATLTANSTLFGVRTVTLTVSNGTASATQSWTITVNRLNQECNNLAQGESCVYVGPSHRNSGGLPTEIRTDSIRDFNFDSSGNVIFIETTNFRVGFFAWFYNRTGAAITFAGKTIPAGRAKTIAGNGASIGTALPANVDDIGASTTNGWGSITHDPVGNDIYAGGVKISNGSTTATQVLPGIVYARSRYHVIGGDRRIYFTGSHWKLQYYRFADSTVYDVVGTGVGTNTGDGAAAAAATVGLNDFAFDSNDNIYLATNNYAVRIICTTIATGNCSAADAVDAGGTNLVISGGTQPAVAGRIYRIAGTTVFSSTPTANGTPTATAISVKAIEVANDHLFILYQNGVAMVNTTAAPVVYAGVTVNAYKIRTVIGGTGSSRVPDGFSSTLGIIANANSLVTWPGAIRRDPITGNLWILESNENSSVGAYFKMSLRQVDAVTGIITTPLGGKSFSQTSTSDGTYADEIAVKNTPYGLAALSDGSLAVGEYGSSSLKVVEATGLIRQKGLISAATDSTQPISLTGMYFPMISAGPSGSVIISSYNGGFVQLWNRLATSLTFVGKTIPADYAGTIAGSSPTLSTSNGNGGQATVAQVYQPRSAASDGTNLYIAEAGANCVRKVDTTGIISTFMGTCLASGNGADNQLPSATLISGPATVITDSTGNVIVVEATNNKVRMVNMQGAQITAFGKTIDPGKTIVIAGGGADHYTDGVSATATAALNAPQSIALEPSTGDLYIAIATTHMVRKVIKTGVNAGKIYTVLGTSTVAYNAGGTPRDASDNGVATATRIFTPYSLAFDSAGDLYVGSYDAPGVRKVKLTP